MAVEKYILVHARENFFRKPIVIKVSAINAIEEEYDVCAPEGDKYYSLILVGDTYIRVKETLKTVIAMIQEAESEDK